MKPKKPRTTGLIVEPDDMDVGMFYCVHGLKNGSMRPVPIAGMAFRLTAMNLPFIVGKLACDPKHDPVTFDTRYLKFQRVTTQFVDAPTPNRGKPMSDQPHEINDVQPSSLSHFLGQASVKAQVSVALEAAWADNKKFDSALLVGPPGTGKSALASIVAQEMASDFHEVLGQSITSNADLNSLLLAAQHKAVVHIDEAHELEKPYQTALYLALDRSKVFLQGGSGRGPQSIPIADFTLLLSTTDEYRLLQPLRDRMKLLLRFEFYSVEELTTIVRQRSQALRWQVEEEVFQQIAVRSRNTPRLSLRLLQSCRRVCRAEGKTTITCPNLERACLLEQIDALGLGVMEQQYLRILAEGNTRLNVLASRLGLPARTVSHVLEPFLLRGPFGQGLIAKDDQGRRQLTALGRDHLSNCRSIDG